MAFVGQQLWTWPSVPYEIVLVQPEIPPNTGNVARLCAATGTPLHLVGPLGFKLTDRTLKRAGLDYWDKVDLRRHESWQAFESAHPGRSLLFYSTRGQRVYSEARHQAGDILVFGSETRGLPESLLSREGALTFMVPMQSGAVRSLNLASTVSLVLYEALRQAQNLGPHPPHSP